MTLIGNGVFVSMDIPDAFLAVCVVVLQQCNRVRPIVSVLKTMQLSTIGENESCCLHSIRGRVDVSLIETLKTRAQSDSTVQILPALVKPCHPLVRVERV